MKYNLANYQYPMFHFAPENLVSENPRERQASGLWKYFLETVKVEIKRSQSLV